MKTTKEQVLKAAETSPEAKQALKELFPDAFESEWESFDDFEKQLSPYISRRNSGDLKEKSLHLDIYFDWSIAIDNEGVQVLQARKKP